MKWLQTSMMSQHTEAHTAERATSQFQTLKNKEVFMASDSWPWGQDCNTDLRPPFSGLVGSLPACRPRSRYFSPLIIIILTTHFL